MTRSMLAFVTTLLFGCVAQPGPDANDAIADFIVVSELKPKDIVRLRDQFNYDYLSENYVVLKARGDYYLVQFQRRCHELREREITPDKRFDRNTLRAGFDTIRGCRIDRMFAIDAAQAKELEFLADESPQ